MASKPFGPSHYAVAHRLAIFTLKKSKVFLAFLPETILLSASHEKGAKHYGGNYFSNSHNVHISMNRGQKA